MSNSKRDASQAALGSSQLEGQGMTSQEVPGGVKVSSTSSKQKK
ncbi:YuzL family protein [Bacillus sp. NTK074B]|nr:YuzL family protein [Bacillus sp. NTK074B]